MKVEKLLLISIIVIILKCVNSNIQINILCGRKISDVQIKYEGIDMKIVSDSVVNSFNITNRNLLTALQNYYGKRPNNVYLKSPTPWGDLYKTYGWKEVKRVLTVESARIKSIKRNPMLILEQDLENPSNKTIKVSVGITQAVENTITSGWSRSREFTVSQNIEYDVNVIFAKIEGNTGFSITSTWGESLERTESVTIGTSTNVETELKPGQAATAVLTANKGELEAEIVYKSSLRGELAVNYKKRHNGHHFFSPSIDKVMKSGNIDNEIITVQTVRVGYYFDSKLKVYDKETKLPL